MSVGEVGVCRYGLLKFSGCALHVAAAGIPCAEAEPSLRVIRREFESLVIRSQRFVGPPLAVVDDTQEVIPSGERWTLFDSRGEASQRAIKVVLAEQFDTTADQELRFGEALAELAKGTNLGEFLASPG